MARLTDVRGALRWGAWVFTGVTLLVFYRSAALDAATRYGHPGVQRAAYAASVVAWLLGAALLVSPQLRRSTIWTLVAVTLAGTGAAIVTLPAGQQHTSTNWAAAANGWLLLAILPGTRLAVLVPLLLAPLAAAMTAAAWGGAAEIVLMSSRAVGILGLQIPVALAAGALERTAHTANAWRLRQEAIRTARVVADTVHDDRLRRSRAVAAVVEPVLVDLAAAGTDPATQRARCAVAAAQVRRLLAEWYRDGPDPLGAQLAACLDRAQAAGVHVDVAIPAADPHPPLPAALSRAACDVVHRLAGTAGARLRVTVLLSAGHARVGIVAHAAPGTGDERAQPLPATVPAPLTIRTTVAGASCLVELSCPL
jgi:hypothetical protein